LDYSLDKIKQATRVYYVAGVLGKKGLPLSDYEQAHIRFLKIVLENMNPSQEIVYVSSAYALNPTEQYELTKIEGERTVKSSGIPYCIVRPCPIFGTRDMHHLPLFKMINKLGRFTPILGDGKNKVSTCHVLDLVEYLIKPPESQFVVADAPITIQDLMGVIAGELNVGKPFIHLPYKQGLMRKMFGVKFLTENKPYYGYHGLIPRRVYIGAAINWYRMHGYL
jgi:nucleoside-diphosphate-sugar epimerase